MTSILHSDLDYAGGYSSPTKLRMRIPMREGPLIEDLKEHPAAQAALIVLNGAEFTLEDKDIYRGTAKVESVAQVKYEQVLITYP
mgnify:CR=1 FL=1